MKYLIEYLPRIDCIQIQIEDDIDSITLKEFTSEALVIEYMYLKNGAEKLKRLKMKLPRIVTIYKDQNLQFIKQSECTWSLRLKLNPKKTIAKEDFTLFGSYDLLIDSNLNKWNKKYLTHLKDFQFKCDCCGFVILDSKTNCQILNEMPSSNWMELMDYWHCHKPDPPIDHNYFLNQDLLSFSSSRYSTLKPLVNEILIDGSSFNTLLDTIKGKVTISQQETTMSLRCFNCSNILGERSSSNDLCKLYKWKLKLQCKKLDALDSYPPQNDVILTIWNYVTNYSGRYILLKCKGHDDVLLWIFALGVGVTLTDNIVYSNSIKVLYVTGDGMEGSHSEDQKQHQHHIAKKNTNIEEIKVNELPYERFLIELNKNNQLLPSINQKFNEWKVSYLPLT